MAKVDVQDLGVIKSRLEKLNKPKKTIKSESILLLMQIFSINEILKLQQSSCKKLKKMDQEVYDDLVHAKRID